MQDDDLRGYQTAETAWRYDSQVARLKADIANTEALLATQRAALKYLYDRPPMYKLLNWSA